MNDLGTRIQRLFPNASMTRDCIVMADANGVYIAKWDEKALGKQPTEAELLAVDLTQPTTEEIEKRAIVALLDKDSSGTITTAEKIEFCFRACKRLLKQAGV